MPANACILTHLEKSLTPQPNEPSADVAAPEERQPWWPYVAPLAVFLGIGALESYLPRYYPLVYILKVIAVTLVLVACRRTWADIRVDGRVVPLAIAVGAFVTLQWVLVTKYVPYAQWSSRTAFDPWLLQDPLQRWAFLAARLYGLVVLIPVVEELFWRSFLMRFITKEKWYTVPVGTFSQPAFWCVAAAFAAAHPEWLAALVCGIAYGWLLGRTRSLYACVVAHMVSNLLLAAYVLGSRDWGFW